MSLLIGMVMCASICMHFFGSASEKVLNTAILYDFTPNTSFLVISSQQQPEFSHFTKIHLEFEPNTRSLDVNFFPVDPSHLQYINYCTAHKQSLETNGMWCIQVSQGTQGAQCTYTALTVSRAGNIVMTYDHWLFAINIHYFYLYHMTISHQKVQTILVFMWFFLEKMLKMQQIMT